ncbi:MAG: ABC transporter substrate-binding protein [Ilumatobacteraceae bacterium]
MNRRTRSRWFATVAATSLVLAACGGSDDGDGASEPATTEAPDTDTTDAAMTEATTAATDMTEMTEATTAGTEMTEMTEATTAATDASSDEPASTDPIKIGMLTSLTGNFAPWGIQVQDGMRLAVQEINDAGGVDGRMIELVEVDDQTNAEEGVAGFERLVEEGVIGVGGIISSDIGLATSPLSDELTTPLFMVKSGAAGVLTKDSRFAFRTCLPAAPMVSGPIVQYAVDNGITKVGAIIADYGWGQSIKAALEADFGAVDGIELQVEVAPVPETDFTTYLRNLESFGPELIVATGHPPGSGPITVQSADLGLDVPVTGAYSQWSLVAGASGDAGIGRYADFDCADFASQGYQDLAKRFLALSDQGFMDDDAVAGFGIVTMLAQAAGEVGDDPTAVAEYLHANTFDLEGYSFQMGWTEWGELATAQPLFSILGAGPAPDGVNENGTWYPETLLLPEPLEPYVPE